MAYIARRRCDFVLTDAGVGPGDANFALTGVTTLPREENRGARNSR